MWHRCLIGFIPNGSEVFILTNITEMYYSNLFVTSCILLLFFQNCFSHMEMNGFTYLKTISKKDEQNVYRNIALPRGKKNNLKMVCCAACGISAECVGVDVCGGTLCRLWNGIFDDIVMKSTSSETCRWYMKNPRNASYTNNPSTVSTRANTSTISDNVTTTRRPIKTTDDFSSTTGSYSASPKPEDMTTSTQPDILTSSTVESTTNESPTTDSESTTAGSIVLSSTTVDLTSKAESTSDESSATESSSLTTGSFVLSSTTVDLTSKAESTSLTTGSLPTSSDEYSTTDDAVSTTNNDVASTTSPVVTISTTDEASTLIPDTVAVMPFEFSNGSIKDVAVYNESDILWIVIQRRFDGSVDFYRSWLDYEAGFGSVQSEFWLGNQYIHELTAYGYTILRIELTNFDGELRQIEYDFSVENKTNNYRLHISEISTSGIDSLERSDLAFFCTFDNDNDNWSATNCADLSKKASGWWHTKQAWCTDGNLNGIYTNARKNNAQGIYWFDWDGQWTLKETRMMLRKP